LENRASERTNYFYGMLMTQDEFETEQEYFLDKTRAHNRLHGWGVVCGLAVEPTLPPSDMVVVQPGAALDCCGREIVLMEPINLRVAGDASRVENPGTVFVVIEYGEDGIHLSPVIGPEEPASQPSRIREIPRLAATRVRPEEPKASPPGNDGVVPCPECPDPRLTLAGIDVREPGPTTQDRIDNSQRRNIHSRHEAEPPTEVADRDPVVAAELDSLQRRVAALTAGVATLAVGTTVALLRSRGSRS
jgi:hypothetical protein